MHRAVVLLMLVLLAACRPEPPITDVPFYTSTPPVILPNEDSLLEPDAALDFSAGEPIVLSAGGTFQFSVTGAFISQAATGSVTYSTIPRFEAIPAHEQVYIAANDADSSEVISFEFSPNLPVGQYPLIAPADFTMGLVSAEYQRLVATDDGAVMERYHEAIEGFLNITATGESISGDFQFTAAYIQRSPEGEVQTQRIEVLGSFADVPHQSTGTNPFDVNVPLPTRIFTGTEAPVNTDVP